MNQDRLLKRFLQYVQVNTTAVEDAGCYPSSPGQIVLGKMIVEQLQEMGIRQVQQDENGIVLATVPARRGYEDAPVVAFNAHFDTSPETTGAGVKPNVIENFDGKDVTLSGDPTKIITHKTCSELPEAAGKTIITTDGTTLLGGDDKCGVAIMMELAQTLLENDEIPHGPVRLLFTCDEEIGKGVDHVSIEEVNATVCYTFDGGGENDVDGETFSADGALVTFTGVNIHPAIAKDKMINAIRAAGKFIDKMPADLAPERTDDRDGFLHPYVLEGGVAKATLKILLRDFDTSKLTGYAEILKQIATDVESECPGCKVNVDVKKQYRNMADGLVDEPRAVDFAVEAHQRLGREANKSIIRGGTDGSRLTELGLPTPNLSSGQHNIHSPLEWACLDEMAAAGEVGIEILKIWATA
jgi:tripeptide aminopeptidase